MIYCMILFLCCFKCDEDGNVVVEFVFLVLIFIFFMMVVVEVGMMLICNIMLECGLDQIVCWICLNIGVVLIYDEFKQMICV